MKIRFSGFGGQGIILLGEVLGAAATIEGKNALQTQSYGSASRGGASKCDVTVSDSEIYELEIEEVDLLVAMSQPALDKYLGQLKKQGILIIDADLVKPVERDCKFYPVNATAIAKEKFANPLFANFIILGYVVGLTGVVSMKSIENASSERVKREVKTNTAAFKVGFKLANPNFQL
ncbi:MAG: 2-oxoacid:acceptor oxidoreductase family protein [Planctomycetota bacterium]